MTEKRKPVDLPPEAHALLREIAARKGLSLREALRVYAVPAIERAHAKIFAVKTSKTRSAARAND